MAEKGQVTINGKTINFFRQNTLGIKSFCCFKF